MTANATCPKCGKSLTFDLGDVEGAIADLLKRLAERVVCDRCAGPQREQPEPPRWEVRLPYADS
jgi:ribosomal protein S27AE